MYPKPHIHLKFEIFWTNIASTMAYPNFKNEPKNELRLLGVKPLLLFMAHDILRLTLGKPFGSCG